MLYIIVNIIHWEGFVSQFFVYKNGFHGNQATHNSAEKKDIDLVF